MKHPRVLLSVFPLLLACGGSSALSAPPPPLDLASVVFKMDLASCTITRTVVFSIDDSGIATQVMAPGALSTTFGTTAAKHVLRASAIGGGSPFQWAPETVTLVKDQSFQALLTC